MSAIEPAWVLDHAPYTPFMDARTAHAPGLSPLDPADWIRRDPDHDAQIAHRRALLASVAGTVLGCLSEGVAPARELAGAIEAFTGAKLPQGGDPLARIGAGVADDFCLLLPDADGGEYRLVAAVLCFPSRWLLSEKMGRPLTRIHDPVPGYEAELSRRVNRVFETLRAGRPLYRINWLVHPTPELHLPLGVSDKLMERAEADDAAPLYLRTERQTLTRLPETGAVAFGIKTTITPLARMAPAEAGPLAMEMRAQGRQMLAYRGGLALADRALAQLDTIAAG